MPSLSIESHLDDDLLIKPSLWIQAVSRAKFLLKANVTNAVRSVIFFLSFYYFFMARLFILACLPHSHDFHVSRLAFSELQALS